MQYRRAPQARRKQRTGIARRARAALSLLCLLTLIGCNQIAGISQGEPRACGQVEDCDLGSKECRAAECKAGRCVYTEVPEGMALPNQVKGDCQEVQCDGQGNLRVVTVPTDNDDGKPCTEDSCVGSTAKHALRASIDCYSGDPLSMNVGICHPGKQACDAGGEAVGPCVGEVLPQPETCLSIYDDDCDGQVNEATGDNCACATGTLQECYGSTVGSLDVGPCVSGYQACTNGLGWGDCNIQVMPIAESCTTPWDDDCDGKINESGADCKCGDGFVSNEEECDDGNTMDGDACSSQCLLPQCGNGSKEANETCDDGNDVDTDACTNQCAPASCGDGVVWIGVETCDDGNLIDTDGCTRTCTSSNCGNHAVEPELGEWCDDGNLIGGDGCQEDCTPSPASIALGDADSCAVFDDGTMKCWGRNESGTLGIESSLNRGDDPNEMGHELPLVKLGANRKVKKASVGDGFVCVILDDDSAKCWGRNDSGQLGLDDTIFRGGAPGSMGDNLPSVKLGEKVKDISAGKSHACAILQSGNVKCWGEGKNGKLGLGSTQNWGYKAGDMAALPTVPLSPGTKAISLVVGWEHTCILQDDAAVRCWGSNTFGQLGQGNTMPLGTSPGQEGGALVNLGTNRIPLALASTMGNSTCAILLSGKLECWGSNGFCELGLNHYNPIGDNGTEIGDNFPLIDVGPAEPVLDVGNGQRQVCALLSGGLVRCWGSNDNGQVGATGSCNVFGASRDPVNLGQGLVATALSVGSSHACVILKSGRVKCWGWNLYGQLGLGDTMDRGIASNQMGLALHPVRLW